MSLFEKPVAEISESDLLALLNSRVQERKTLEYKQGKVGSSDGDRREFLADASSFANAQGGYLIFGMEEEQGAATKLAGLANIDSDAETARLDQMLRSGISPPLSRFDIQAVPLSNGNLAIVLHIARSPSAPHQVTYQNTSRFWARGNVGKYLIGVDELRTMFLNLSRIPDLIEKSRANRVAAICAGKAPVPLMDQGILLVQVVPFSSFGSANSFQFGEAAKNCGSFAPMWTSFPQNQQVTHEGLITMSNSEAPPKPQRAYVSVSRSGVLEAVISTLGNSERWIALPELQARIIKHSYDYMRALRIYGGDAPVAVLVDFLRVKDIRILHDFAHGGVFREDMPSGTISHTKLSFTKTIFDTVPRDAQECARRLRPTLDHIANAAGLPLAPYFDANGNSTLRIFE